MEIGEVQINDWVNLRGIKEKVREIAYDEIMRPYISFAASATLFRQYLKDTTPVPLTESILRQNNIEHIEDSTYGWWENDKNGIECTRCGGWWRVVIHNYVKGGLANSVILYGVQYVHELQHALRTCGLIEFADKIEM